MKTSCGTQLRSLVMDHQKVNGRLSFVALSQEGVFKVGRNPQLQCGDLVLFETTPGPRGHVSEQLLEKTITNNVNIELKLH